MEQTYCLQTKTEAKQLVKSSEGNGIRTNYQTASFVVGLRDYIVQFQFDGLIV